MTKSPDKPGAKGEIVAGRSSRTAHTVAVLMGGPSAEREVSLSSGRECANALRVAGYEVIEIKLGAEHGTEIVTRLTEASTPECV